MFSPRGRALLVFAAAVLLYAGTLGNGLVWDDPILLAQIEERGFPGFLAAEFLKPGSGYYRPLTLASLWLDRELGGGRAWIFHLTNLLLHAANSALVLRLLTRLATPGAALWGALFFAAHPAAVEATAFVSGRTDLWCALFALVLTLAWLTLRERRPAPARRWAGWGALLLLGGLAKETLFVLPALLLLLDGFREGPPGDARPGWWTRNRAPLLAAGAALAALLALRWLVAGVGFGMGVASLEQQRQAAAVSDLALAPRILASYLRFVLWPWPLTARHTVEQLPGAGAAAGILLLFAAVCGWTATRRFRRAGALGCILALGFLLPVSGIVRLGGSVVSERFLYLPNIGFALLFGAVVEQSFLRPAPRRALQGAAAAGLALFAALSLRQSRVWRDEVSLFENAVAASPGSLVAKSELEEAYRRAGREGEALRLRGEVMQTLGYADRAADAFRAALALPGGDTPEVRARLGRACLDTGRFAEAALHFQSVLAARPDDPDALEGLVVALAGSGDRLRARQVLERLRARDPARAGRLVRQPG